MQRKTNNKIRVVGGSNTDMIVKTAEKSRRDFGTKGSAVLGEGIAKPFIFEGYERKKEKVIWESKKEAPSRRSAWGFFASTFVQMPQKTHRRSRFQHTLPRILP